MFYLRASLTILLSMLLGCNKSPESERPEGILISWLAESNKSNPCVVVATGTNADRLVKIGKQDYGCIGRSKIIAHSPSEAGFARILSTIPVNPKLGDGNSDLYPWHVIQLNAKGFDAFRLND